MLKIAHSVIVDTKIKENISKETLDSWMILYNRGSYVRTSTVYPYLDNMWHSGNVDLLLDHYKDQDLDYLILNWFGVYCSDFWLWHNECISYIEKLNKEDWIFAGQIISKEHQKKDDKFKNHFYPYPISAIINLKTWRQIGCPKWHDKEIDLFHVPQMSEDFIHDDYTPVKLYPTGKQTALSNAEPGAGFISKILDQGYPIHNIPVEVRNKMLHTYPENDPVSWDKTMQAYMNMPLLTDQKHYEFMKHAMQYKNLRHAPENRKGVFFLYNTEEVFPKTFKDKCIDKLQNVDTIIGPCSMFKAFILGSYSTSVKNYVHFDIFDRNVLWKEIITEKWNGEYENLVEVLSDLPDNSEFGFWNRVEDNIIEKQYNTLLNYFDTSENLKKQWLNYKNKNHKYVKANLLFDDKKIVESVKELNSKVVYNAIGDIPGYMINGINFGIHNVTRQTISHLDKLKNITDEVYIDLKVPVSDYQIFDNYENTKNTLLSSIVKAEY